MPLVTVDPLHGLGVLMKVPGGHDRAREAARIGGAGTRADRCIPGRGREPLAGQAGAGKAAMLDAAVRPASEGGFCGC